MSSYFINKTISQMLKDVVCISVIQLPKTIMCSCSLQQLLIRAIGMLFSELYRGLFVIHWHNCVGFQSLDKPPVFRDIWKIIIKTEAIAFLSSLNNQDFMLFHLNLLLSTEVNWIVDWQQFYIAVQRSVIIIYVALIIFTWMTCFLSYACLMLFWWDWEYCLPPKKKTIWYRRFMSYLIIEIVANS